MAMLGNVDAALADLDTILVTSDDISDADQLALLLLKAEILYLECREADALALFEADIEPKLSATSQEDRFVVGQNKRDVVFGGFLPIEGRQASVLHDQQQIVGTKLWDAPAIVRAHEAALSGRHYDAVPTLWRELLSSYDQRVWSYHRQASKRLAQEFIQIGWAHVADFYALLAQDSQVAGVIAESLLSWRNGDFIQAVVQRLMLHANLKRHAVVACRIFVRLADVVPDGQVTPLTGWLLQRASIVPSGFSDLNLVNLAWDALAALVPRLNSELAKEVVKAAMSHKSWKEAKEDRVREHIVRTVDGCVVVLPSEDLPSLAKESLHMAVGMSEDTNLDENALHLFRNIAHRADSNTKELIINALYDKPSVNFELLRVAGEFGKTIGSEEAQRLAEACASDLKLQVQRLSADDEFKKPMVSMGQITLTAGPKKVAVSIYSDICLRAVIAHRELLDKDTISLLVDSVVAMLHEPENTLANKVSMINAITALADVITTDLAEKVLLILRPIASGEVTSLDLSHVIPPNHPLNPNTMNLGNPETVQGGALLALATIESSLPSVYGARLATMIEDAMTNPNSEVRTLAFVAARRLPAISDSALMKTLLATRDNVADIVVEAFLILNDHVRDTEEFWSSLAYSLKIAVESPNTDIRRVVAFTIRNLSDRCENEIVTNHFTSMKVLLENDVSYEVRKELSAIAT